MQLYSQAAINSQIFLKNKDHLTHACYKEEYKLVQLMQTEKFPYLGQAKSGENHFYLNLHSRIIN